MNRLLALFPLLAALAAFAAPVQSTVVTTNPHAHFVPDHYLR